MIPGQNLLNSALTLIGKQTFYYSTFASRDLQPNGQYMVTYNPPVLITGSVQPVPHELFQQYGLDFEKTYLNFYVARNVIDIQRDVTGDQMQFQGNRYQCLKVTPWFGIDGWTAVLCVLVPNC